MVLECLSTDHLQNAKEEAWQYFGPLIQIDITSEGQANKHEPPNMMSRRGRNIFYIKFGPRKI